MATTEFIAAIELGSSKITGVAGRKNSDGSMQILAYAQGRLFNVYPQRSYLQSGQDSTKPDFYHQQTGR